MKASSEPDPPDLPEEVARRLGLDDDDAWLEAVRTAESPIRLGEIGGYELLEEVGRGGQGVVYRAHQPSHGREIALKRLIAGSFASPRTYRRFEREVEVASSLDHPNIVSVYGMTDVVDGQPLIAMEWIDGTPVTRWAESESGTGEPLAPRRLMPLMLEICDAVQHAHQRGVIHRDLKPSNILVDASGAPHLLDFGLAKILSPEEDVTTLTLSEQFVGTPAYAAPEQLRGTADVDVRADVYSLGVIFYELLTGRLPYDVHGRSADWARALADAEPRRPSSVRPRLGAELDTILLKCLSKEPRERYQSVDALSGDLRRYTAGEPLLAHPPSAWYQLRKLIRRHTWPFALALILVVLALAFAVWSADQRAKLEEQIGLVLSAQTEAAEQAAAALSAKDAALAAQAEAEAAEETARRAQAEAEAAEAEARAQARRADAVRDFLAHDVLAAVDPEQTVGDGTVLEALERAELRLGSRFDADPRTRAVLQQTIGRIYVNIARPDDAEPLLDAALGYFEETFGDDHPDTLSARSALGELRIARGEHDAARELLDDVRARQERVDGVRATDRLATLQALAELARKEGRYDDAVARLERATELYRGAYGPDAPPNLAIVKRLQSVYSLQGRIEETEALLKRTLEEARALEGPDDLRVSALLYNLGFHYHSRSMDDEAVPVLREALAIEMEHLREDHPRIGQVKMQLARALDAVGQDDEALRLAREGLQVQEASLGALNPRVLGAKLQLAGFVSRAGRDPEALALLEEGLEGFRRLGDTEREEYAVSLVSYGFLLHARGDHDRGVETMLEGVAMLERMPGGARHLAIAHWHLARAAQEAGRDADALEHFRVCAREFAAAPYEHRLVHRVLIELGTLAHDAGLMDEAFEAFDGVLAIERRGIPEGPRAFAASLRYVGGLAIEAERWEEGAALLREYLEVVAAEELDDGPDGPVVAHYGLSRAARGLEDAEDELEHLRLAAEHAVGSLGVGHAATREVVEELAALHEERGEPDEARAWRELLE